MGGDNRVFCSWDNGSFIVLGAGGYTASDFQELVEQHGPPDTVEFRAAGEGYSEGWDFDDDEDSEEDDARATQHQA